MSYKRNIWNNNDLITEEKLNRLEYAVEKSSLGAYKTTGEGTPDIASNSTFLLGKMTGNSIDVPVKYVTTSTDILFYPNQLFSSSSDYGSTDFPFIMITDNDAYYIQKGIRWIPLLIDKENSSSTNIVYKISMSGSDYALTSITLTNEKIGLAIATSESEDEIRWAGDNASTGGNADSFLTRSSETGNYTGTKSEMSFYISGASFDGTSLSITNISVQRQYNLARFGHAYIVPISTDTEGLQWSEAETSFKGTPQSSNYSLEYPVSIMSLTRKDVFGNRLRSLNGMGVLDFDNINTYIEDYTITVHK